ncbi:unnamed protein product [Blepharisma stoltei]|uniref:Uncharacterized protein n=1 Tax=Blepharisma stoltei TaxID=1481888 RepID=A0AAU9J794_9CILI|nr:unnamed protein product [Blepharisma stoltei]
MFSRAIKTKFNERKYMMQSIVRNRRIEDEDLQPAAKRFGLIMGLCLTFSLIKLKRKDPSHKTNYTRWSKGLYTLPNLPWYKKLEEGSVPMKKQPTALYPDV